MPHRFPEEIDIFLKPHLRMKELVDLYSSKVQCVDIYDDSAVICLLNGLYLTLKEFKSHELIENTFIMAELEERLFQQHIFNSAVCNCHSDNRIAELLHIVQSGENIYQKGVIERLEYGRELRRSFENFVENFIPHMQEEEEIFQPLLVEHFDYEELKILCDTVIKEHEKIMEEQELGNFYFEQAEFFDNVNSADVSYFYSLQSSEVREPSRIDISYLPPNILCAVFSYLNPPDRGVCAQVCKSWNAAVYDPSLWKTLYPVQWARGIWCWKDMGLAAELEETSWSSMKYKDEDADVTEDDQENNFLVANEIKVLQGLVYWVVPRVGTGVKKIILDAGVSNFSRLVQQLLIKCPNVQVLSAAYTNVFYHAFKGISQSGCLQHLEYLDMQGCSEITDEALECISHCYRPLASSSAMDNVVHCSFHDARPSYCSLYDSVINGLGRECCLKMLSPDNAMYKLKLCKGNRPECSDGSCHQSRFADIEDSYIVESFHDDTMNSASNMNPRASLISVNLSGCHRITDDGILVLLDSWALRRVEYLDLSGCFRLSEGVLNLLPEECPNLKPEHFACCDNYDVGPYPKQRSGCGNLSHPIRYCCRYGE